MNNKNKLKAQQTNNIKKKLNKIQKIKTIKKKNK